MAFLETKYAYTVGVVTPARLASCRSVSARRPSSRTISHAVARSFARVAPRSASRHPTSGVVFDIVQRDLRGVLTTVNRHSCGYQLLDPVGGRRRRSCLAYRLSEPGGGAAVRTVNDEVLKHLPDLGGGGFASNKPPG